MKINCIRFTLTEIASIFESLVVNKAKFFYFFRQNQIIFRTVAEFKKFRQLYHLGIRQRFVQEVGYFLRLPFKVLLLLTTNCFITDDDTRCEK